MTVQMEVIQQKGRALNGHGRPEVLPFINPATGEQFGQVALSSPAEVTAARREMAAAAPGWVAKTVKERVAIVRQLQQLLIDELDEITAVMNRDNGKSRQDALTEVFMTVDLVAQYCRNAPAWLRRQRIPTGLQIFKRAYQEHKPYGVVGIIGPWNYPLVLMVPPIVSALLAGNTVVAKPSEVTAATGVMIEQLFERVPGLAPYVRFLHGDGRVGAGLVQSQPDLIFLTGSTKTGRLVMKAAAENMTPVICELGGKDPMIVLEDAAVKAAAQWGTWGAFYNTGQTCMAVERVYVAKEVYAEFIAAVLDTVNEMQVGYSPETQNPNDLGPLTFQRQIDIVESHLQDAVAKGAKILTGGQREGMFMAPTVLVNVDHSMKIMQEETFGPLLPIMKVESEAHAIQLANHSNFGLSASVWSRDLKRAQRVGDQLEVGSVNINDTMSHFAIPHLPFGGVKDSGIGRTHSRRDMLQFTQSRAYVVGKPPRRFDIATIMREPGQYRLAKSILHLAFGVTLEQRLAPIKELVEEAEMAPKIKKAAAGAAGAGLLTAGLILGLRQKNK